MGTASPEAVRGQPTTERSHAMPHSLDAIYRKSARDVCRWAAALGGPGIDADDVAQEVFLVVQRRLDQFEGDDPSPWLYAITVRVVRTARRGAWFRRALLGGRGDLDALTDPGPTPDVAAEGRQDRRLLYQLLGRLSEKRRSVLALFEIGGYSTEEIARLEGVPPATVRSRLFEARRSFLALVAEHRRDRRRRREAGEGGL